MKVPNVHPEEEIRNEATWRIQATKRNLDGTKVYYVCRFGRKCPSKRYIFYPNDNSPAVLYTNEEDHVEHEGPKRGIPSHTKNAIKELFQDGVQKPKQILSANTPTITGFDMASPWPSLGKGLSWIC